MRTVVMVCVITASAFIGSSVRASLLSPYAVPDQYQENWNHSYDVGSTTAMAQTFRANLSGTLDHIEIGTPDFGFDSASTPLVTLYLGEPNNDLSGSGLTLLTTFDLSYSGFDTKFNNGSVLGHPQEHITINANTMYSIMLEADVPSTAWVGAVKDPELYPYSRGDLWAWGLWDEEGGGAETWERLSLSGPPVYDMQFRTYVVPVPLPAGVLLGICAVSVAGWHLRRQRG